MMRNADIVRAVNRATCTVDGTRSVVGLRAASGGIAMHGQVCA